MVYNHQSKKSFLTVYYLNKVIKWQLLLFSGSHRFNLLTMTGLSHDRLFTFSCHVGDKKANGTASTKKGAKEIAARNLIKIIDSYQNEEYSLQILELPNIEEILAEYRRLTKNKDYTKPKNAGVRRRNLFAYKTKEQRNSAIEILKGNDPFLGSSGDIVARTCKSLNVEYDISDIPRHRKNYKIFTVTNTDSNYDCVLVGSPHELHDMIIDYFKTMLDVE